MNSRRQTGTAPRPVDDRLDADVIGVGFGPANLALAIALEELWPEPELLFLESRPGPSWQSGMLLDRSDVQHHPSRDLVTPRNPRSRYTFMNYLHEEGRLFEFLNLPVPFALRKDYARYVVWAAEQFADQVVYGAAAQRVEVEHGDGGARLAVRLADGRVCRARAVVVAPGRAPLVPAPFREVAADQRVLHCTEYLDRVAMLGAIPGLRLAIVGASQSAVELMLDASTRFPDATVFNVMRGFGYRQKDVSPFNEEVYFPEFVDYYYEASDASKSDLNAQLRYTNYSAADADIIEELYLRLYEHRLDGREQLRLLRNTEVLQCRGGPRELELQLLERHRGTMSELPVDAVVLATGFQDLTDEHGGQFLPDLLGPVAPAVARTPGGRAEIGRDYRLLPAPGASLPPIYLNGLCETSHGMGDAGSFSLLSYRSAAIVESLAKALTAESALDHTGGVQA
jgi:L-ornithine N5-oxygenase